MSSGVAEMTVRRDIIYVYMYTFSCRDESASRMSCWSIGLVNKVSPVSRHLQLNLDKRGFGGRNFWMSKCQVRVFKK